MTQDNIDDQVKIGDKIYVPPSYYLSHGRDDFDGGLATIIGIKSDMSAGEIVPFVTLKERPSSSYNLQLLMEEQGELKKRYGKQVARPDPDWREEFNRDD